MKGRLSVRRLIKVKHRWERKTGVGDGIKKDGDVFPPVKNAGNRYFIIVLLLLGMKRFSYDALAVYIVVYTEHGN